MAFYIHKRAIEISLAGIELPFSLHGHSECLFKDFM